MPQRWTLAIPPVPPFAMDIAVRERVQGFQVAPVGERDKYVGGVGSVADHGCGVSEICGVAG